MRGQLLLLYSYLHGIWQYRWSALVISCVIAMFGWALVYALPNQYVSQAVLHIDTQSVMKPLMKGLAVDSNEVDGLDIMSRVLLSRKNLEEVIRVTDMDLKVDNQEDMDELVKNFADSIVLKESNPRNKRNDMNNIYDLSYKGSSPELVYQVVSKLLNTLIENTLDSARTDTASAQQFLDRQINAYESRLTQAEQALAEFKRANVGFMPDENGGYYRGLQREQSKLDAVGSELRLAKRKHSQMLKQLEGEAPLLDNNSYGAPKVLKLRRYREQLESLLTQYTEQHPDVQALRASIASVMANESVEQGEFVDTGSGDSVEFNPVYQELKAEVHRASVEVETLKMKLFEQKNHVEELKQAVDIFPEVEAKLAKLNRDYEITRERYLDLVARRESARLAQEVGQSGSNINFRIIDPPRVPQKPVGPDRLLFLTLVFFVATAAGLGWGFLRYLLQPTFIDVSQVRDMTGFPVLGTVGLFVSAEHKIKRKIQLTYFLMALTLLVVSYTGVMVFSGPGSDLVAALISHGRSVI